MFLESEAAQRAAIEPPPEPFKTADGKTKDRLTRHGNVAIDPKLDFSPADYGTLRFPESIVR
jgi:hypothetical protein